MAASSPVPDKSTEADGSSAVGAASAAGGASIVSIPQLGFGTAPLQGEECSSAVCAGS